MILIFCTLGDFQAASLTVVFEGTTLSMEEVCSLHLPPPWKIQGSALYYGLGMISGYFLCDLMTIVSGGYFYIFDPLGLALSTHSNGAPSARLFSLIGLTPSLMSLLYLTCLTSPTNSHEKSLCP